MLTLPSSIASVPWQDIAVLDVDIPVAPWWLAKALFYVLSTTDAAEGASSQGAHSGTSMRRGNKDIAVTATLHDGSTVQGWAMKHQVLGYPEPEARAAIADTPEAAWALAHLPPALSSVSLLVQPLTATVAAWLLFGEALRP